MSVVLKGIFHIHEFTDPDLYNFTFDSGWGISTWPWIHSIVLDYSILKSTLIKSIFLVHMTNIGEYVTKLSSGN